MAASGAFSTPPILSGVGAFPERRREANGFGYIDGMGKLTSRLLVVSITFGALFFVHSISRAAPPPPAPPPPGSVTGWETVHTNKSVLSHTTVDINAKCPPNKRVVGGGYSIHAGGTVYMTVPSADGKYWRLVVGNSGTTATPASVWAVCVNAVP